MVTSRLGALSGIFVRCSSTTGESRGERCFRSLLGPASTTGESELDPPGADADGDADAVGAGDIGTPSEVSEVMRALDRFSPLGPVFFLSSMVSLIRRYCSACQADGKNVIG